jgi:methionyl-tRNA formyltransferase
MALHIVFMGTPDFAVPTLERLAADGHSLLAVTQPARPAGRGLRPRPSPVASAAERLGIQVLERATLKGDEAAAPIRQYAPDLLVVVAFGLILRRRLLDLPRLLPVNLHPSLLPRHRGVAPIPWTILAGDSETAVSTIRMDQGIDTGDLLLVERTPVEPRDNAVTLATRLARMGADLVSRTVQAAADGELEPRPQGDAGVTYAPRLAKEHGYLDWRRPATVLDRQIRAMAGWPGALASFGRDVVEIVNAEVVGEAGAESVAAGTGPGTIMAINDRGMEVATGAGSLRLLELKPAGKRVMAPAAFARGRGIGVSGIWGSLPGALDPGPEGRGATGGGSGDRVPGRRGP